MIILNKLFGVFFISYTREFYSKVCDKSKIHTILVTGSSGMIGTRLCERLLEKRYNLIGVDKDKNAFHRVVDELTHNIDLREPSKLSLLPTNIDLIIHLAANARVHNLVREPLLARNNFEITFNILEFARLNNINKVLFSSSREVYGNCTDYLCSEDRESIRNTASTYAASKIACESLLWSYQKCYGIDVVLLRFSNVYGLYDISDRVIPQFIQQALLGDNLIIYGKDKIVDFTYIDDTIEAILLAINKFDLIRNDTYNIAGNKGTSICDIAKIIVSKLNSPSKLEIKENRKGEILRYVADISKAKYTIGYHPKTRIEQGISKAISWYLPIYERSLSNMQ